MSQSIHAMLLRLAFADGRPQGQINHMERINTDEGSSNDSAIIISFSSEIVNTKPQEVFS